MQPLSDSQIRQQIIPDQQRRPLHREATPSAVKTPLRIDKTALAEDVVTLTNERSSSLSAKKAPSAPVTQDEYKALRESFSVYA